MTEQEIKNNFVDVRIRCEIPEYLKGSPLDEIEGAFQTMLDWAYQGWNEEYRSIKDNPSRHSATIKRLLDWYKCLESANVLIATTPKDFMEYYLNKE